MISALTVTSLSEEVEGKAKSLRSLFTSLFGSYLVLLFFFPEGDLKIGHFLIVRGR